MKLKYFSKVIVVDIRISAITAFLAIVALTAAVSAVTREKSDLVITADPTGINAASGVDIAGNSGQAENGQNNGNNNNNGNSEIREIRGEGADGQTGVNNDTGTKQQNTAVDEDLIRVYVSGCVKNSGVFRLKKGSIIEDAIKAAGGPTADADLENINLAFELSDNDMIRIPSKKDSSQQAAGSGTGSVQGGNTPSAVIRDSGGAVIRTSPAREPERLVNINTATAEELKTLPGIGEQTARDIIEYREKNGPFSEISDIMKVPGIKESRFSKIKDKICVN